MLSWLDDILGDVGDWDDPSPREEFGRLKGKNQLIGSECFRNTRGVSSDRDGRDSRAAGPLVDSASGRDRNGKRVTSTRDDHSL